MAEHTHAQYISELNDLLKDTMTGPRLAIKGQKVGSGPILGDLCPFSKTVRIFPPLDRI